MKKIFLILVLCVLALAGYCSFDGAVCSNSPTITGRTINGKLKLVKREFIDGNYLYSFGESITDEIDEVRAVSICKSKESVVVGKTSVLNGQFSLTLFEPIVFCLENIADDLEEGVLISKKRTKGYNIILYGYKNGEMVKWIKLFPINLSEDVDVSSIMYVNRDARVTGSENDGNYTIEYDVALKKGFNTIVARTIGGSVKITANNEPADMIWGWVVERE